MKIHRTKIEQITEINLSDTTALVTHDGKRKKKLGTSSDKYCGVAFLKALTKSSQQNGRLERDFFWKPLDFLEFQRSKK